MNCTAAEKDLKKRFEGIYERGQLPAIRTLSAASLDVTTEPTAGLRALKPTTFANYSNCARAIACWMSEQVADGPGSTWLNSRAAMSCW